MDVEPDETPQGGRPKSCDDQDMLGLLPPEGLSSTDWKDAAKSECGISERKFFYARKALETAGRILKSKISGKWQPIKKP